jgi:stage V sporulation protein B
MRRIIGPEGTGLYNYSFEVYNIALIISSYSLPLAVSRLVAVRRVKKEHRNSYRLFLCAMAFAVSAGILTTTVIFLGADFIAEFAFKSPNVALPLRVLAPTILIFAIMGVFRGFYQGKNTMIPTAVSQVLEQVVNAVVSIAASIMFIKNYSANINVASYGAAGSTLGTFTGACIGLIFLLFVFILYKPLINKQIRNDHTGNTESYKTIFKLLFITIAPIILSQTVYQVSGLIDGALFGNVLNTKKITVFDSEVLQALPGQLYTSTHRDKLWGIYSGEYRLLTNVPVAIATAIGAAIVTTLSADQVKGYIDNIRSKVQSAIKFNMIIAIPSAVGMSVLALPINSLLFNDNYRLSANILILGSVSIVFFAYSTITTAILQGINKIKIPVINSAISLGIHIVLVYGLLQFTGLSTYALVIGNVTFPLVVSILNWLSIERYLNYRQELIKTFVIPALCAGLMGTAAYFIYYGVNILTGSMLLSTLVSILMAIIIYFLLLVLLKGVNESEIEQLPKGKAFLKIFKKLHLI